MQEHLRLANRQLKEMTEEVTDLKRTVQEKENDLQHLQGENKLRMEELRAAADDVAAKAESMRNAVGDLLSEARRVV